MVGVSYEIDMERRKVRKGSGGEKKEIEKE